MTAHYGRLLMASCALAYLACMFQAGVDPTLGQFQSYEVAGLLRVPVQEVTRIELRRASGITTWIRRGGHWRQGDQPLAEAFAGKLDLALKMLHGSAPVRTLDTDAARLAEYGLAPPVLTVTLSNDAGELLHLALGAKSPDGILRYALTADAGQVMLVSGFVGAAWEEAAAETSAR